MISLLAASLISPFFVDFTPEVRTTYVSLGKIVEDRPMQTDFIRVGYDAGTFGRFGIYNFDVSSLTDRRADVHRHALYHTEFGPFWDYDWKIADDWTLRNGLMAVVTLYRGFDDDASNGDYGWIQVGQSLENPYVVPYYRMRRYGLDTDYFYFRIGVRRKCRFLERFYVTPEICVDGGNSRNYRRVIGTNVNDRDGDWGHGGVSSITFRLEAGWEINANFTLFAFVEQYEVTGEDARDSNAASSNPCAHNDWTLGGVGLRMWF